jgi:death-on-curing protein
VERISETLTFDEVVEINRQQIDMFGGLFVPPNNCHNQDSLEYALEAVDAVSFGQELYPSLPDKAALLAFKIIKNHIFHDGNKRTAITVCRVFLLLNGYDLEIEINGVDQAAINIAIDVANSVVNRERLAEWISERMQPIE